MDALKESGHSVKPMVCIAVLPGATKHLVVGVSHRPRLGAANGNKFGLVFRTIAQKLGIIYSHDAFESSWIHLDTDIVNRFLAELRMSLANYSTLWLVSTHCTSFWHAELWVHSHQHICGSDFPALPAHMLGSTALCIIGSCYWSRLTKVGPLVYGELSHLVHNLVKTSSQREGAPAALWLWMLLMMITCFNMDLAANCSLWVRAFSINPWIPAL